MFNIVGGGQLFETKAGGAVGLIGPDNALGAQRAGQAQHIDNVPARIALFPLPFVGIIKIAIKRETRDFIIETQAVIADTAGARLG